MYGDTVKVAVVHGSPRIGKWDRNYKPVCTVHESSDVVYCTEILALMVSTLSMIT